MGFVPFHKGSTTVGKGKAVVVAVSKLPAAKKAVPATAKVAKPSGMGPKGSAGYFDNC